MPHFPRRLLITLDSYFSRIGYTGSTEPALETLRAIQLHHVTSIPFENFDVLLGRGIALEIESIERKLVTDRRGGYCFEQNGLLLHVLQTLGFKVTPISARVRLDRTRDVMPPRTHLFLRVEIDGVPWMADVGVGSMSLTTPIRFDLDEEQPTLHEPRRVTREGNRFFHQAKLGGNWIDVHEFTGEEMYPIDRDLGNWWTSTNPNSKFRQNIMASRANADGTRYAIQNREFTHRRASDGAHLASETISTTERLLELLRVNFGLHFAADTKFGPYGL